MATKQHVSVEKREKLIAEAAYFRAVERGFERGDPVSDWLEAERQIDAKFNVSPHDKKLEQLFEQLSEANEKIRDAAATLKKEARNEWEEDLKRLHELKDSFAEKIHEVRDQTGDAKQKAARQAEKIWQEMLESLKRTGVYPE